MTRHEILGGLVQVYRRGEGRHWHCSASVDGNQHRVTTKEDDLTLAKEFAEDWYLALRGKARAGLLKRERPFVRQLTSSSRNTSSLPTDTAASDGSAELRDHIRHGP